MISREQARHISLDIMSWDNTKRHARVNLGAMCGECAALYENELRPYQSAFITPTLPLFR